MHDEKELKKVIELISSHIISKINDKNIAKIVTGKVVSANNTNKTCVVKIPYDETEMTVPIQTYEELSAGDEVILLYWESYTNLMVIKKKG